MAGPVALSRFHRRDKQEKPASNRAISTFGNRRTLYPAEVSSSAVCGKRSRSEGAGFEANEAG